MNKKHSTPPITLDSAKSNAAAAADEELAIAQGRYDTAQEAALKRQMTGNELAAVRDELELARIRANLAGAEAEQERADLAPDTEIHAALQQFLSDPALAVSEFNDAFEQLRHALAAIETANSTRNAAVTAWVQKLRALGIPDTGLSIDGEDVSIYTSATAGTTITIGGNQISALRTPSAYIAHVVKPHTRDARSQSFDPATLTRLDKRDSKHASIIRVQITRELGGKPAGHIITSRENSATNLARMVRDGNAELLEGTLPDISEDTARTYLPVGSDTTPLEGTPTPRQAHDTSRDDAEVNRAVDAAFS